MRPPTARRRARVNRTIPRRTPPVHTRGTQRSPKDWVGMIAILVGVVPAMLSVARIVVFAQFDLASIQILLQTLNIAAIATDSAILLVPWLATAFAFALGFAVGQLIQLKVRSTKVRDWLTLLTFSACAGALLGTMPFMPMGGFACGFAFASARNEQVSSVPGRKIFRLLKRFFLASALVGVVLVVALGLMGIYVRLYQMWLPIEAVAYRGGGQFGYVLQAGDHHLTFMSHNTRKIEILKADDVESRTLCQIPNILETSLWSYETDPVPRKSVGVPECSELVR